MATFTNIQTTEAGQVLLAQVHAGSEQLRVTGIAFGSGIWTEEEYAARNLTTLKNEVLRVAPSGGEQAGGVADITCVLTNAALETGFALTELGVIAKKADDTEVLYMVDSVEAAKSTWISPASEHLMQIPVELRIACSSTSQIDIRIESTAPVTSADMENHNVAPDAHADIREKLQTQGNAISQSGVPHGGCLFFDGAVNSEGRPLDPITSEAMLAFGVCDGRTYESPDGRQVSTVNARDKFIVVAGGKYEVGASGGADRVTITNSTSAPHVHTIESGNTSNIGGATPFTSAATVKSSYSTDSVGDGQAHENRPPYLGLFLIKRL